MGGPGTNKYKPKDDIGKTAGAAKQADMYRRPGTAASGPQSATAEYTPTTDIGKQAPAANSEDGYRRTANASGPQSAIKDYTPTTDIGKQAPAANSEDGYVFNLRNTMNDENVGGKLDAADKEAITKIVDETIAWMDSTYEVLEKDVYDAKQKEVEAIVNPIMTKLYQQAGAGAGGMGGMPGGMPAGFDPSQFGGAAPGAGAPNEPQVDDID